MLGGSNGLNKVFHITCLAILFFFYFSASERKNKRKLFLSADLHNLF